jgi:hypothetical protein
LGFVINLVNMFLGFVVDMNLYFISTIGNEIIFIYSCCRLLHPAASMGAPSLPVCHRLASLAFALFVGLFSRLCLGRLLHGCHFEDLKVFINLSCTGVHSKIEDMMEQKKACHRPGQPTADGLKEVDSYKFNLSKNGCRLKGIRFSQPVWSLPHDKAAENAQDCPKRCILEPSAGLFFVAASGWHFLPPYGFHSSAKPFIQVLQITST